MTLITRHQSFSDFTKQLQTLHLPLISLEATMYASHLYRPL